MAKKKAEEKKQSAQDLVDQLLAMDANIPPETVPTLLEKLEGFRGELKVVDNHLLMIAGSMIQRLELVKKRQRAERRRAAFNWTLGLVARAGKAVGGAVATVVTAPVRLARAKISGKPAKKKTARTSRSKSSKSGTKKATAATAKA